MKAHPFAEPHKPHRARSGSRATFGSLPDHSRGSDDPLRATYRLPRLVLLLGIALLLSPMAGGARAGDLPAAVPPAIAADAENVAFVGHVGGSKRAVAVQGSYAYVGEGPALTVLDISDPALPTLLGRTLPLPRVVKDVAVDSSYAYVVAASDYGDVSRYLGEGLWVVDVSDPANPVVVGLYNMPGVERRIALVGHYAYVATDSYWVGDQQVAEGGLWVLDVSNPAKPQPVGSYDTPGQALEMAVGGDYLYVIADLASLRVLDVSDPSGPVEVGFYDPPREAIGVHVSGDCVYIAERYIVEDDFTRLPPLPDYAGSLRVLDVSNPAAPREVGLYDVPESASGVTVAGDYAYVTDADGGLWVVDISDPANPTGVGSYASPYWVFDAIVVGDYLYFADGEDGLRVLDVSDPANLKQVGLYSSPGCLLNVHISRDYAYVIGCTGRGGYVLWVVDVSGPSSPQVVGLYDAPGHEADVAVVGRYAYVASRGEWDGSQYTGTGLWVLDVSDPANPQEVGFYDMPLGVSVVAVSDGYAYLGVTIEGMWVLDVSDPANPQEVGSYHTQGRVLDLAITGGYAYIAGHPSGMGDCGRLWIVDVSDPSNPTEVGSYDTPGWASDVAISDGYAYLGVEYEGMWVVDVSDPANPTKVGFYDTPDDAWDLAVTRGCAYAANTERGLRVLDVSDPSQPIEVGFYDTPGCAMAVAVASGYAYVADGDGGLYVLRYRPASISGRVRDGSANPMAGVRVAASAAYSATTDAGGWYTVTGVSSGTYTLRPTTPGYVWSPASRTVTVPPDASGQDFVGRHVDKAVTPSGVRGVGYGGTLTYTVRVAFPEPRDVVLYDPVPAYTTYVSGSLAGPPGLAYDPAANAVGGPLSLAAGVPQTVTFAVRAMEIGTKGLVPIITNRACVYPFDGTLSGCLWSNEVRSYTYVFSVYLPVVVR